MKVLHLLKSNRFSGAENVVSLVIKALEGTKDIEQVYCSPEGPIRDTLAEKGVPYLGIRQMSRIEICKAIEKYNPDIIHAHGTIAGFNAAAVCGHRKLILHIHNNSKNSSRLSKKSLANLLPFFKSRHVIWVSQDCLDSYLFSSFVKRKSTVISNGIDLTIYNQARRPVDKNKLVMVSRFAPAKDQKTVVKAMALIDQRFHLYFVGDGEKKKECENLVKEMNLEHRVHFLGSRSDIPQIIGDSYIGIQSSHWEGFGMSAVELMACGIPVIASDAEGLKQVVEGAGVLFKTEDEVDLANAIKSLSSDISYYNKVSKACLERAKNFNIDETAYKCLEIYNNILGR